MDEDEEEDLEEGKNTPENAVRRTASDLHYIEVFCHAFRLCVAVSIKVF